MARTGELRSPVARRNIMRALEDLAELDADPPYERAFAYDNISFVLEGVTDEGDLREFLGDILYDEREVRALEGFRAASDCLYALLGGPATHLRVVTHPHFPALVCTAAYAHLVMSECGSKPLAPKDV